MDCAKPQSEHQWLRQLVGDWTFTSEAVMAPGQPPMKGSGTERVRSIGGLWVVGEGQGEMPGCDAATMILTLGFDPARNKFVGTWIGSMMSHLWVYEGSLDASGRVLTLDTQGPDMTQEGKTGRYRDVIEIKGDAHRVLTSHALGPDARWTRFMTAEYRRKV